MEMESPIDFGHYKASETPEGIAVAERRNFLKKGMATLLGIASAVPGSGSGAHGGGG